MRHRVKTTKIRQKSQLKALIRNLATSLIMHESIETTEKKAKTVQPVVEKLISTVLKKEEDREAIRALQKVVFTKEASVKLLTDLKKRFSGRNSGFTRIIQTGVRKGDAAPLVRLEFVSSDSK